MSATARSATPAARSTRWMQVLVVLLALLFVGLQVRLGFGEGSVAALHLLDGKLEAQRVTNTALEQRRAKLAAQVSALKNGNSEIEMRARQDLGLVKPGETFYMMVDE